MKKYLLTLYAILLASTAFAQFPFQPTEFVTLVSISGSQSQTVTLAEGDIIALLNIGSISNVSNSRITVEAVISNITFSLGNLTPNSSGSFVVPLASPSIATGPAQIRLKSTPTAASSFATLAIFRANAASAQPNLIPQNTVVIPEDATGTLQIILESSNDLINWTAALPGNYSAETAQRFFRVRAVLQ